MSPKEFVEALKQYGDQEQPVEKAVYLRFANPDASDVAVRQMVETPSGAVVRLDKDAGGKLLGIEMRSLDAETRAGEGRLGPVPRPDSGSPDGHWLLTTGGPESAFVDYEVWNGNGAMRLYVFVDETAKRVMVEFSEGSKVPLDVFLPGLQEAAAKLSADLEQGYSGVDPSSYLADQ